MQAQQYLQLYVDSSLAMGYSPRTLDGRKRMLKHFFGWCEDRSITDPANVTRPMLERYRRYLYHLRQKSGKPLSLISQRHYLTAVKMFYQWMTRENHVLHNPASELILPRPHKRLPKAILSQDEVERVLKQTLLSEDAIRDRAMLETLYASGIRRAELTNLKLDDIDLEQHTLMVREGKGKKDRLLPISSRAAEWINRYLIDIRPNVVVEPDYGYLFLNHKGQALTPHQLSDRVRNYLERAGIKKPGACHLFRHTMATLMLENGADIRFIQAMLGHADISTTQIYTQVSIKKLKDVYERTHPTGLPLAMRDRHDDPPATDEGIYRALALEAEEEN